MENNKSLVLIDAYSQIYRAFYAVRMLTNSRGQCGVCIYKIPASTGKKSSF